MVFRTSFGIVVRTKSKTFSNWFGFLSFMAGHYFNVNLLIELKYVFDKATEVEEFQIKKFQRNVFWIQTFWKYQLNLFCFELQPIRGSEFEMEVFPAHIFKTKITSSQSEFSILKFPLVFQNKDRILSVFKKVWNNR